MWLKYNGVWLKLWAAQLALSRLSPGESEELPLLFLETFSYFHESSISPMVSSPTQRLSASRGTAVAQVYIVLTFSLRYSPAPTRKRTKAVD